MSCENDKVKLKINNRKTTIDSLNVEIKQNTLK